MVLSLNKDIGEMKFNDQLSNEDILNYSNPKVITNKETFLGDAVEVANNMHKVTNPEQSGNDKENWFCKKLCVNWIKSTPFWQ